LNTWLLAVAVVDLLVFTVHTGVQAVVVVL
jgi:hypothetical protein